MKMEDPKFEKFELELALSSQSVISRNGQKVVFISRMPEEVCDFKERPLLVKFKDQMGFHMFLENGRFKSDTENHEFDLFMAPKVEMTKPSRRFVARVDGVFCVKIADNPDQEKAYEAHPIFHEWLDDTFQEFEVKQ